MPHDVFISYSRKDAARVGEVMDFLKASGVSVWIDKAGIDGGCDWSEEIVKAISF